MSDNLKTPITRERLGELLRAKVEAQKAYSYASGVRFQKALSTDEQIDADLACSRALSVSCTADRAYHDALVAFGQQEDAS